MIGKSALAEVVGVQISKAHAFSKTPSDAIRLIENFGVEGDAHAGATDRHRYHVRRFGQQPNLRQVHLIQSELFDELSDKGHAVRPGELGENVATRNIDLLSLPTGTRLRLGGAAVIELTGLRNPCSQIEDFQPGLLRHVVETTTGGLVRRAGVMSIVLKGGEVRPGDEIEIELPPLPHTPLVYRVPELEVVVASIETAADDVRSLELRAIDNGALPPFTAGSHINLLLPGDMTRSYSLSNDPSERDRYVVLVRRDHGSRGGSSYIHEQLKTGDRLRIHPPHNNFVMDESARHTILVAGGIGITPLRSMIHRLASQRMDWQLFYAVRHRDGAAFLSELEKIGNANPGRIHLHFGADTRGGRLDIPAIVRHAPDQSHFYCCGPQSMIASFEEATADLPRERVHVERFSGRQPAVEGGFEIHLRRTGLSIPMPRGLSILDALLAAGVDVPYSCKEGVCGCCKVRVLDGLPDHRDVILHAEQQARNDQIITCCSGSLTPTLVLDI